MNCISSLSDRDIEAIVEGNEEKASLDKLSEMSRYACIMIEGSESSTHTLFLKRAEF